MAKQIKVIKCPQCGSVNATEQKEDYYICQDCNSQFFLDNDAITINHKYVNPPTTAADFLSKNNKYILWGIGGLIAFWTLVVFIMSVVGEAKHKSQPSHSAPVKIAKAEEKESLSRSENVIFRAKNGQIYFIVAGLVEVGFGKEKTENNVKYIIYDLKGNKLKEKYLSLNLNINAGIDKGIDLAVINDDDLYMVVNNYYPFIFDQADMAFKDISQAIYKANALFKDGIIGFEIERDESIKITNNRGDIYYYHPYLNKVYSEQNRSDIEREKFNDLTEHIGYVFSEKSRDFPKKPKMLIEYRYLKKKGLPVAGPNFQWRKQYNGGRGGFIRVNENTPYQTILINGWEKQRSRLISFKDFTPGRDYVTAMVVGFDDQAVYIAVKNSVMSQDTYILKKLSRKNGSEILVKKSEIAEFRYAEVLGDNIVINTSYGKYIFLDKEFNQLSALDKNALIK